MEAKAVNKLRFLDELELSVKEKSDIVTHPRKDAIPVIITKNSFGDYEVKKIVKYIQVTVNGDVLCLSLIHI